MDVDDLSTIARSYKALKKNLSLKLTGKVSREKAKNTMFLPNGMAERLRGYGGCFVVSHPSTICWSSPEEWTSYSTGQAWQAQTHTDKELKKKNLRHRLPKYDLPELPWLNGPSEFNRAGQAQTDTDF